MAKSIRGTKKGRGRPRTTGAGVQIGMRWQEALLDQVDAWAKQQDEPSRPEAIRRLVEMGLAAAQNTAPTSPRAAAKARTMARAAIDQLSDPSAPPEERENRKRRLLKGPPEFREMRPPLPKRKG